MTTLLAIALMLSSVAAPVFGARKPAPSIGVGEPFPILELPLANHPDQSASIMDYRGRKLMLHLFASW